MSKGERYTVGLAPAPADDGKVYQPPDGILRLSIMEVEEVDNRGTLRPTRFWAYDAKASKYVETATAPDYTAADRSYESERNRPVPLPFLEDLVSAWVYRKMGKQLRAAQGAIWHLRAKVAGFIYPFSHDE